MSLVLHPLFATSCLDDPITGATAREIREALHDHIALTALFELAPAAEATLDGGQMEQKPAPTADHDFDPPSPSAPRFSRG